MELYNLFASHKSCASFSLLVAISFMSKRTSLVLLKIISCVFLLYSIDSRLWCNFNVPIGKRRYRFSQLNKFLIASQSPLLSSHEKFMEYGLMGYTTSPIMALALCPYPRCSPSVKNQASSFPSRNLSTSLTLSSPRFLIVGLSLKN